MNNKMIWPKRMVPPLFIELTGSEKHICKGHNLLTSKI